MADTLFPKTANMWHGLKRNSEETKDNAKISTLKHIIIQSGVNELRNITEAKNLYDMLIRLQRTLILEAG